MKRPLMTAAGGFVLGEVCLLFLRWWGLLIPAVLSVGVAYLRRNGKDRLWWILPFFCILGMGRLQWDEWQQERYQQIFIQVKEERVELTGTVEQVSEKKNSTALNLKNVTVSMGEETWRCEGIQLLVQDSQKAAIGMQVRATGELSGFDTASNPGQFDFAAYYHSQGLNGRMYGDELEIIDSSYSVYHQGIAAVKRKAMQVLEQICTEKELGIFEAVLLGEKGQLDGQIQELYQRNGIAHLLAVSGLHISLIGMGCYRLLRRLGGSITHAGCLAAFVTVSYGILTGGAANVVRAVTMVVFQLAADKLGRTYDMLSAMACAAIGLLLEAPTLLFQTGFQLSFGAIIGIGMVYPVLCRKLQAKKGLEQSVILSLSIQIVTVPALAYHFFEYPIYGIALNLLAIPLMSNVVISGLLGIGIGSVWLPGGTAAIGMGHYVLWLYEWLCRRFETLPGAVWMVGRPELWQIVGYGMFWVIWLKRRQERKQVCLCRVWFAAAVIVSFLGLQAFPPGNLEVTFLDVGQGDGTVLQTQSGCVLIDGGSTDEKQLGEQVLEPFFKSKGIRRIDYAIVTHGDQDHISGLMYLLESCPEISVERLILPHRGKGDEACGKLQKLAEAVGTEVLWMKAGSKIQMGDLELHCLYAGEELQGQERNDQSPLIEVRYGQVGIFLTGDMSAEGEHQWLSRAEAWKSESQIQLLKAAHHGSRYSTSQEFLQKIQPELTIISCGKGNSYGHPHEEVLKRLEEAGGEYAVTMECGAVIVKIGRRIRVSFTF